MSDEEDSFSLRCYRLLCCTKSSQVKEKTCEAQSESGTNTPDRPAGGAEGSEIGNEVTHSDIQVKLLANPVDDNGVQTATTTRQESLPLTTKPLDTDVTCTSRTHQQAQVSQTTEPIQESTRQEPPEEDEHYDVLLLYSKHDIREAQKILHIGKKPEKEKWKVITCDEFSLDKTKFKSFEAAFKNSSYTVLLLTSNFIADVWCEHHYQAALTQSIQNPKKKHTIIPIICQDENVKIPMELEIYNMVKLTSTGSEERLLKNIKVEKRLKREKKTNIKGDHAIC